jgi:predicted DsbA family dithiol-disulfide isomerase
MRIDIFHDTVCPWCRIGKKNVMDAVSQWGEPVEIRWRAFILDPSIPEQGLPFRETMQRKFGGNADLSQLFGQVARAGEAVGVHFDFDKVQMMPNTRLSHRLIALAPEEKKAEIVEAINRAYFEEGRDTGRLDVLLQVASETGLDADSLRGRLERGEAVDQLEKDLAFGRQAGITGVPFFILNGKYALTGAQPVAAFLQAFERVKPESGPQA